MVKHVQKHKQRELDKYLSSYQFSFDNLLALTKSGIKTGERGFTMRGAFRNGSYLGCPGKDIHFALEYMSEEQEDILADVFVSVIPGVPPGSYEHISASLRYIYGCFDKQGCLLSKKHKKMISEFSWEHPDRFIEKLEKRLLRLDNHFGLLVLYEMKAHRLGDRAVISKDPSLSEMMVRCYEKSLSYMPKLSAKYKKYTYRHTPYFWCARYLEGFSRGKAVQYYVKHLRTIEKYNHDGYVPKIKHSIKYIKKNNRKKWDKLRVEVRGYKKKCFVILRNSL